MQLNFNELFNSYLSIVTRLVPKPPALPVIGIDIGTSTIKAAVITPSGNELELTAWDLERIESSDIKGALTRLLVRVPWAGKVPVIAVSGKGTLIRYIDLPRMPLDDLRKSFVYDLDKYFPFDPQSIYSDCFILDDKTKDKRMPVLVAAVKKESVDERLKLFKELGVDVDHVSINSIAIANAFERLGPTLVETTHAKAILDIGSLVSNLLIIKDGVPRFTRDIFVGSQEMTRQIANNLGIDQAQAEQLKCSPGGRLEEITNACEAAVAHLVSETRLSMDYFMTEKNIQVDEFYLVGGGAQFKDIGSAFEKNLGVPVKIWDPLSRLKLSKSVSESNISTHSSQLGVAVGLAMTKI